MEEKNAKRIELVELLNRKSIKSNEINSNVLKHLNKNLTKTNHGIFLSLNYGARFALMNETPLDCRLFNFKVHRRN